MLDLSLNSITSFASALKSVTVSGELQQRVSRIYRRSAFDERAAPEQTARPRKPLVHSGLVAGDSV
jgi:hypothetical protein